MITIRCSKITIVILIHKILMIVWYVYDLQMRQISYKDQICRSDQIKVIVRPSEMNNTET